MRNIGVILCTGVLLTVSACSAPDVATVGDRAPDYAARDMDGTSVRLVDLRGEVVLLNIWATWCYPCRREMPALEDLHRELRGAGLRVVAVSVDAAGAGGDIREFLEELDLTMDVLHDSRATVSKAFSTMGVPETFLIGGDGTLLHHWRGRIDPHAPGVRGRVLDALAALPGRQARP
jgi:cytochrome c biogenesis protein CcmG, thiol:disulfide interchange protein DsbE